jgi:hypothetical protein
MSSHKNKLVIGLLALACLGCVTVGLMMRQTTSTSRPGAPSIVGRVANGPFEGGGLVVRVPDSETGVMCWVYSGGGISCMTHRMALDE